MFSAYVSVWNATLRRLEDPVCFFSNVAVGKELSINEAVLTLEEGSAGSFEFTITPANVANDLIKTVTSIIYVVKDGNLTTPFWMGRVISEERDSYDQRKIVCEGILNCLMDTYQMPKHITSGISSWLQYLLVQDYHDPEAPAGQYAHCHNELIGDESWKEVVIKYFDPNAELDETVDWYTDYETTFDMVKNAVEAYNLKMEVTYENQKINLSFYKDYPGNLQSDQVITFGRNLISYTRNWSVDDLATVIIPTGKKYRADDEERPTVPYTPPDLDAVVTIESVNSGSIELEASSDIIARYGRICKKIEWNDIEDPANLLDLAENYFSNYQWDKLSLEVELYDLSLLMTGAEKAANELKLLGTVRCVSRPHGLDRYFPITKVEYDLNNPGNTKFTLGDADKTSTLTGTVTSANGKLKDDIDKNKVQESRIFNEVISRAFDDATALMNNYANTGHVAFTKNPLDGSQLTGIVIADSVNWSAATSKLWMWNQGGLAWSEDGGRTFEGVAITNDGRISADFITAGRLDASIIRAGTLQDVTGNTKWNLETGTMLTKDFVLETYSTEQPPTVTPGTDGYLYLSNKIWHDASYYKGSGATVTIAGLQSSNWRMIIGTHFGVTNDGTMAVNEGRIGDIGIGSGYLRTHSNTLGTRSSFYLGAVDSITAFPQEGSYEAGGVTRDDWRFSIGSAFGVTNSGIVYSTDGHFNRATVTGSFSASVLNASSLNSGGTSVNMGQTVYEAGQQSFNRYVCVEVTEVRLGANGNYESVVKAYEINHQTWARQATDIEFYLGYWFHSQNTEGDWTPRIDESWVSAEAPPWNKYFNPSNYNVYGTPFTIRVPANGSEVTMVCNVPSAISKLSIGGVYIKQNYENNVYASPSAIISDGKYTVTRDALYVEWTPDGTAHSAVGIGGSLAPLRNGSDILGAQGRAWKQLYATNSTILSSARCMKKDIAEIPDNFDIFFDALRPIQFRWMGTDELEKHNGFILDEVGTALRVADIQPEEFAGYVLFNPKDSYGTGGIRYEEFISLNTWQIQKAKQRISELEERIEALERERNE